MTIRRFQFGFTLLIALFLVAVLFAMLLYAFTPANPAARGPILLASFIAILLGSLLAILFLLRWVLRPYQQLLGEAERASVSQLQKSSDEADMHGSAQLLPRGSANESSPAFLPAYSHLIVTDSP
jgi:disulfide bond formation protein DsbB